MNSAPETSDVVCIRSGPSSSRRPRSHPRRPSSKAVPQRGQQQQGVVAVGICVFLAGCFLIADARRGGPRGDAAPRTLGVGLVTGLVVFTGLLPLHADAPTPWDGLTGRALPLVLVAFVAGLATLGLLLAQRYALARLTAVVPAASVVSGWGVGQLAWLLVDEITVGDAAGATATLQGLLVAFGLAAVLVLPPLVYLLRLTQTEQWSRTTH